MLRAPARTLADHPDQGEGSVVAVDLVPVVAQLIILVTLAGPP
jgi:hypothetical protein